MYLRLNSYFWKKFKTSLLKTHHNFQGLALGIWDYGSKFYHFLILAQDQGHLASKDCHQGQQIFWLKHKLRKNSAQGCVCFKLGGKKTQRLCAFFGCGAVQGREVKLFRFMQKLYKHQEFLTWLLSANYERNVIANNLMRNLPRVSHGFLVSKVG